MQDKLWRQSQKIQVIIAMLLSERLIAFFSFLIIAIIASLCVRSFGLFHLPEKNKKSHTNITGSQVIGGFVVLMAVEIFAIPFFYYLWMYFKEGKLPDFSPHKLDITQQGWLNIFAIIATALALLIYCLIIGKSTMREVWGRGIYHFKGGNVLNLLIGASMWIVAYPLIVALGQLIGIILSLFYLGPHADQLAVKHLKNIIDNPWVFPITVIEIVTLVPIVEELIFRGFLQTWLKDKVGISKSIIITSLVFAFFHFSVGQGIDNIELISSLFVLSCFLGFLRERQQSLWGSIGLHATFNAISIFLLSKIGCIFLL